MCFSYFSGTADSFGPNLRRRHLIGPDWKHTSQPSHTLGLRDGGGVKVKQPLYPSCSQRADSLVKLKKKEKKNTVTLGSIAICSWLWVVSAPSLFSFLLLLTGEFTDSGHHKRLWVSCCYREELRHLRSRCLLQIPRICRASCTGSTRKEFWEPC